MQCKIQNASEINIVNYMKYNVLKTKNMCEDATIHSYIIFEQCDYRLEETFTQAVYLYMHISRMLSLLLYHSDTDTPFVLTPKSNLFTNHKLLSREISFNTLSHINFIPLQ